MTDKKELKDVWEEMEEIEPLTPNTEDKTKDIIETKVMFDPFISPPKPFKKWR